MENDLFNFGDAIARTKIGAKVARKGWNGTGMFVFFTEGRTVPNNKERSFAHFDTDEIVLRSHLDMKAADGSYVSGWTASQTDILAKDWYEV